MGLSVIPSDLSNLEPGERRFAKRIMSIYSDAEHECYLYVQPRIKQLNPDFILIDPYKGIVVIEVKDWSKGYIKEANNVHIIDVAGKRVDNPLVKANKYFNFLKSILQSKQLFFDQYGNFELLVYSRVIFPNMKPDDLEEYTQQFNQPSSECIFDNQLRKLSVDTLFSQDSRFLDNNAVSMIRGLLFPEVKIKPFQTKIWTFNRKDGANNPIIDTLDAEQEKFARQIPYGHFMVTGVPGSGKTVILLSRAIHLLKEKPGWKIRILTYNKPLANKLRERFESFHDDLDLMGVNYQNITISTFHSLAAEVSTESPPLVKNQNYWDNQLPLNALQNAMPTYDAILIDEYQDFKDHWIQLCRKVCRKHSYNGVDTENLFMAGDRLQSIYNSKGHSWKSIGVNVVGRSKLLKTSYRSGSNHINLALDYLMGDESLKKEIEKFYEGRDGVSCISDIDNSVDFIRGNMESVNCYLKDLFVNESYSPEDVIVLVPRSDYVDSVYRYLDDELKLISFSGNNLQANKMNITTYHRSKGLEYKVCVLLDVDHVKNKKALYVGMTRASEKLCIHSFSLEGGKKFNDLMSYYDEMIADVVPETVVYDDAIVPSPKKKKFSAKKIQKEYPNAYTPWTKNQEMKLIELYESGKSIEEMSNAIGRQPGGVKARLKKLGIRYWECDDPQEDLQSSPVHIDKEKIDDIGCLDDDFGFEFADEDSSASPIEKLDKSSETSSRNGLRGGFRDKFKKLTSFMSKNVSAVDDSLQNGEDYIIAESSQKWVSIAIASIESDHKYQFNDTAKKTHDLLKSGHDAYEIAKIRDLKVGTIATHIISLALSGKETPFSLISKEIDHNTQMKIIEELRYNGFIFKRETKKAVGDDITYYQIDMIIALLISCNKKNKN